STHLTSHDSFRALQCSASVEIAASWLRSHAQGANLTDPVVEDHIRSRAVEIWCPDSYYLFLPLCGIEVPERDARPLSARSEALMRHRNLQGEAPKEETYA
ncbi:MAG: hypothetical protein O7C39_02755, partial [Bacteroidetes bacterium]|nr:hypothetical protein [Bacteroidota bacterium]